MSVRDRIVAAASAPDTKVIDVPEWGGPVRLRAMTYAQREAFQRSIEALRDAEDQAIGLMTAMLRLVIVSVVDDANERVFADGDEEVVRGFNFAGYAKVRDEAQRLNGMRAAKEGEEDESPLAV